MKPMFKRDKFDLALLSQNLNGPATGTYYNMAKYRKGLFIWQVDAMAAAATSAAQVLEATDAAGAGSQAIAAATATITANTLVTSALLTSALVHVADEVYTINGLEFTAAAADVPGTRTYAVGADAAASTANLAAKINSTNPNVGVPGVTASANVGALTLTSTDPGEVAITLAASVAAVGVPSTLSAIGYVEFDVSEMDLADNYSHVALRITNSAATQTAAFLIRGDGRFEPVQAATGN